MDAIAVLNCQKFERIKAVEWKKKQVASSRLGMIRSLDASGAEIQIKVKRTTVVSSELFYRSENERSYAVGCWIQILYEVSIEET